MNRNARRCGGSAWRVVVRGALIVALASMAVLLCNGTAAADCAVGYSTNADRVDGAFEDAALIVTGTVVALERHPADPTGGGPVDVATVDVDTVYRLDDPGMRTVLVASVGETSLTRTFTVGERYFIAARDSGSAGGDAQVQRWAPYVDDICTPSTQVSALDPDFFAALDDRLAADTVAPQAPDSAQKDSAQKEGTDADGGAVLPVVVGAVVIAAFAVGGGIMWRRRSVNRSR